MRKSIFTDANDRPLWQKSGLLAYMHTYIDIYKISDFYIMKYIVCANFVHCIFLYFFGNRGKYL